VCFLEFKAVRDKRRNLWEGGRGGWGIQTRIKTENGDGKKGPELNFSRRVRKDSTGLEGGRLKVLGGMEGVRCYYPLGMGKHRGHGGTKNAATILKI